MNREQQKEMFPNRKAVERRDTIDIPDDFGANTMYPLLDCVRAYATVGEMCDALRDVWGEYEEVPSI